MWERGLSIDLIADLALTPIEKVANILHEYLDKEKVIYIQNLFGEGKTLQEIAQSSQMPLEKVQQIIEQLILPLQKVKAEKEDEEKS
jgi:hypothetical protein